MRPALFVSDLHLSPERPAIVERFFRFLREEARAAAALYILGDLLEHWIGDDDADEPFNRDLFARVAELAGGGVEVFLMHGNRDFLVSTTAAARAGMTLIPDAVERELFG
ncbi:MAG: metallophosphoesterase, partial [Burkholderiales bacterium]